MRKESFQGILLGVVIMCAVFAFITIAWAAFSSTLTISGSATINKQKWAVEFTDNAAVQWSSSTALSGNVNSTQATTTDATFALTANNVAGGNLGTLNVGGDEITYSWYIKNFGTFDANASVTTAGGFFTSTTVPSELSTAGNTTGNIRVTCVDHDSPSDTTKNDHAQDICDEFVIATLSIGGSKYDGSAFNILKEDGSSSNDDVKAVTLKIEFKNKGNANLPSTSDAKIDVTIPNLVLTVNQGTTSNS